MELEEAIKILNELKEEVSLFSTGWRNKLKDDEIQAIATVLQSLKNLQEENRLLKNGQSIGRFAEVNVENLSEVLSPYYIPKKKIENEIEILKAQCGGNVFHIQQTLNAKIRLLQELLED